MRFAEEWRLALERTSNVDFYQDMVSSLIIEGNTVTGVKTSLGIPIYGKSVVLTNGTFLNGLIHIGERQLGGGRAGEKASSGITEQLVALGFESGRMKTGTPPRVDGRSLDYSVMIPQPGDAQPEKFSYTNTKPLATQRDCHMTHTSSLVHDLLREGFDRSRDWIFRDVLSRIELRSRTTEDSQQILQIVTVWLWTAPAGIVGY